MVSSVPIAWRLGHIIVGVLGMRAASQIHQPAEVALLRDLYLHGHRAS
jgi:hypothetical protein